MWQDASQVYPKRDARSYSSVTVAAASLLLSATPHSITKDPSPSGNASFMETTNKNLELGRILPEIRDIVTFIMSSEGSP